MKRLAVTIAALSSLCACNDSPVIQRTSGPYHIEGCRDNGFELTTVMS